ncbi:unnamed protein product [Lactuca saligna]|uniref:Uncharacterized protein n=1 Tax=Lactuca saligna TaxID=75948 RepID=A0AA35ZEY5_LACSI|nr:unnamed protein product [Lactuca saligna]
MVAESSPGQLIMISPPIVKLGNNTEDEVVELPLKNNLHIFFDPFLRQNEIHDKESNEFAVGVIDAKTWSKMIEEKIPKIIPKTPIRTPPSEPETINAWELMEGLDDTSLLRPKSAANHIRSFSFHVNPNSFTSFGESATEFP